MGENGLKKAIEFLKSASWYTYLSEHEREAFNLFIKNSLAKQRKSIVMVERVKDGYIYIAYQLTVDKKEDKVKLVTPGKMYSRKLSETVPQEVQNLPRLAFTTLYLLGDIIENRTD